MKFALHIARASELGGGLSCPVENALLWAFLPDWKPRADITLRRAGFFRALNCFHFGKSFSLQVCNHLRDFFVKSNERVLQFLHSFCPSVLISIKHGGIRKCPKSVRRAG